MAVGREGRYGRDLHPSYPQLAIQSVHHVWPVRGLETHVGNLKSPQEARRKAKKGQDGQQQKCEVFMLVKAQEELHTSVCQSQGKGTSQYLIRRSYQLAAAAAEYSSMCKSVCSMCTSVCSMSDSACVDVEALKRWKCVVRRRVEMWERGG